MAVRARPEVPGVRLFLLVPRSVGLLGQREPARFIEVPRRRVPLEGPELEPLGGGLGDIEEFGAEAAALRCGTDVELLDPAVTERDNPAQLVAVETSPDAAGRKDTLAVEPAVLVRRVQPDKPRHRLVERDSVDLGRRDHVGEREARAVGASVLDPERAIDPPVHGRQRLGQIFGD